MTSNTILNGKISITAQLQAYDSFFEAMDAAKSDLEKAGAIQRFEYCYELSWKLMKRILAHKGVETNSPRDAFREAAKNHIIDDPEKWFFFLKNRNLTSHTYNKDIAEEVFSMLPDFRAELEKLIKHIRTL